MRQRTGLVVVALAIVGIFATFVLLRRADDAAEHDPTPKTAQQAPAKRGKSPVAARDGGDPRPASVRAVGRVLDAEGSKPIKGAVVSLRRHDASASESAVTTRSDPGGAWTARELEPGAYAVAATAPGYLPGVIRRADVARGTAPIDVMLTRGGHRLHGNVRDVTGGVVDGAQVRATPLSVLKTRERDGFGTLANGEGAYEMFVAAGRYQIAVSHPDYARATRTIEVGPGTRGQDFELTPTGVIEGVVVQDTTREPVPNAWVQFHGERTIPGGPAGDLRFPVGEGAVQADAEGRFALRGIESGSISIQARAKGWASHAPTVVPVAIAEHVEVEVEVGEAFEIRGTVVSSEDQDTVVAGAHVTFNGLGPGRSGGSTTADADGKFVLDGVLPGGLMVFASADGYLSAFPGERINVTGDTHDLVISLSRGQAIVGRVEPPTVAEVSLELRPENFEMGGSFAVLASNASTESGEDGAFTLQPVAAGKHTLAARASDGREGEVTLTLAEGGASDVVIRLEERATLHGEVVSQRGEPIGEALVSLRRIRNDGKQFRLNINGREMGGSTGSTTDQGAYTVEGLRVGDYAVSVSDRFGDALRIESGVAKQGESWTLGVPSAADIDGVRIVVEAHDGVISGVVRDSEGEPTPDAWVRATPIPADEEPPEPEAGTTQRSETRMIIAADGAGFLSRPPVLTDEEGRFEIRGLSDVEHVVSAELAGGTARARELARPGATLKLELAAPGSVRGTVTVDGQAADGFMVSALGTSSRSERVRSGGSFELGGLDPGSYVVEARGAKGSGSAKVTVASGKTAEVTIAMQNFITVTGRLVDKAGAPIAGVEALVGQGEGGRVEISSDGTEENNATDAEGRFEVQCAAGKRVLVFMKAGGLPRAVHFFTAELGKTELDLGDITENQG